MLSSGSAQTLEDGIYLSHHSTKPEHLCDESHCRGKQHFQTEELTGSMSPVALCPTSQHFPSSPPHPRHTVIGQIPITASITRCSWRLDLAFSRPSLCSLLFWFPNIHTPTGWPRNPAHSLSPAHLCLSLSPSCQCAWNTNFQKDASSFFKVLWC